MNRKFQSSKKFDKIPSKFTKSASDIGKDVAAKGKFDFKPNDPSWYAKDPALLRDAASLSFYEPLGSNRFMYSKATTGYRHTAGALVLDFIPTVGSVFEGSLATAPINIAAANIYAEIRAKISGSRKYEPNDLIMYIVAVTDLYGWLSALMRVYSLLMTYKLDNWYFARHYVEALGFRFNDLIKHIIDLRFYINKCIHNLDAYAVPAKMSLVQRRCWMNLNMFADEPVKKAQLYFYRQIAFYKYENENVKCTLKPLFNDQHTETTLTFDDIVTFTEDLISGLRNVEDVGTMSGDVLKTYGEGGLLTLSPIPENFHVEVTYSVEVLNQIHNTIVVTPTPAEYEGQRYLENLDRFSLEESGVLIRYNTSSGRPCWVMAPIGNHESYRDDYIDLLDDDQSPERIMVATRNMTFLDVLETGDDVDLYEVIACGTELFTNMNIVFLSSDTDATQRYTGLSTFMNKYLLSSQPTKWSGVLQAITQFSHAPRLYLNYSKDNILPVLNIVSNFAKIDARDLDNMSHAAVISEFTLK